MSDNENLEALQKANDYLSKQRIQLQKDNRFFVDDNNFNKYLEEIFESSKVFINPKTEFFRARKFDFHEVDENKLGTQFEGYSKNESFVNKKNDWPNYGRMNPQGISVLYVASDIRTSITELHPYFSEIYSVATIINNEELKIADLSSPYSSIQDDFKRNLALLVNDFLSEGSGLKDYIFPQYISSYCKHLNYDGIGYRSKYARKKDLQDKMGINYAIFNYDKCEVIDSKIFEIEKVAVKYIPYKRRQL